MKAVAAFLLLLCGLVQGNGRGGRGSPIRPPIRPPFIPTYRWSCREAPRLYGATQVDAGMGKVVVSDRYKRTFFLSGVSWYRLGRLGMKHVSVGPAGIWSTCYNNKVYKYVAGDFKPAIGVSMSQVDAGGDGQVVGVGHGTFRAHCLRESSALSFCGRGRLSWTYLSRLLRYYSCGPQKGCWGVDRFSRTWVTKSMTASSCATSGWALVAGPKMKMIEASTDGRVFGVTTTGKVYERLGISHSIKQGRFWRLVPMCMAVKHVSFDLKHLWVVTNSGLVMKCTH